MKCSLGISNFLEEISSLSHSVVFLYFFELIAEEGFLISPCYSLLFSPFLLCFSLLFFSQLFVRLTAILLFCISFSWGWSWSLSPAQCHEPLSIVRQALWCQQIWKTQQWPQDWKRSVFIPIPKKGNAKECSNYRTTALISHTSETMLKILQARLQQYVKRELPDVQAGFRKGWGTRDQIANIR